MRPVSGPAVMLAGLCAGRASAWGLIGFGLHPYDPLCAESCLRSFGSLMLPCSSMDTGNHMMTVTTPASCRAESTPFLTSVAWCMSQKCAGFPASKLESYWQGWVTGDKTVAPKWTYSQALLNLDPSPPTRQLNSSDTHLNVTSIVDPLMYLMQWNGCGGSLNESILESKLSISVVVLSVGVPILMTWLGYIPFIPGIYDRLRPYLLYPSTVGTYSVRPLPYLLGNAPTVGQGIYVAFFVIVNVVFTAVDYGTRQPNAWFETPRRELLAYLLYRTGALGFALLPVLFLFSSRNNLLLWLTNWSHSTYILLHRWVGRVFAIYCILHSIFGLLAYPQYETKVWWAWGAVATVFSVVLWLGSGLYFRRANYELFLLLHIILAVFVVVGCWYHLILSYNDMGMHFPDYTSAYENWLYIACAVWFFDRLVRVGRVLRSGVRNSKVTDLGGGYVRVDIPGIRWGVEPGKHVYVYFPTLTPLRPWENHPFSIIPTPILHSRGVNPESNGSTNGSGHDDAEKGKKVEVASGLAHTLNENTAAGVTLFIKKSAGTTKHLERHDSLFTLLEGPYHSGNSKDLLRCDRMLLIGGGIGITGLLPWIYNHWNLKLAWSVKDSASCLVEEIEPALSHVSVVDKDIRIGRRFDVGELIAEEEAAGWKKVAVIVSGPGSLCDDVRAAVAAAGRRGKTIFELEVDAYSW